MKFTTSGRALKLALFSSTLLSATSGLAQTAPGGDAAPAQVAQVSSAPSALAEVVVTARRRSETLISTPVSVTAFTSQAIQDRDIKSLADVAAFTPNLTLSNAAVEQNDRSNQTLIIRGMTPGNSATTSVFIDGAPISSGRIAGVDDVERVEVLKGPQSAAFGRETFAGAVNVVTRTPSDELGGRFDAKLGTDGLTDDSAAIEGPIVPGKLSARLSARYYKIDGQFQNPAQPGYPLGSQSTKSANFLLYFTPIDRLRIKLFATGYEDDDGPPGIKKYGNLDYNCNAGATPGGNFNYICGKLPDNPVLPVTSNTIITPLFQQGVIQNSFNKLAPLFPNNLGLDHGGLLTKGYHTHLLIEYDVPRLHATLSSLSSASGSNLATINDYANDPRDRTPNAAFGVTPNVPPTTSWLFDLQTHSADYAQELRLTSDGTSQLKWTVGANYAHSILQTYTGALIPSGVASFQSGNPVTTNTLAGFFALSYDVTRQATISVEGREQRDKISSQTRAVPTGVLTPAASGTFNNFVPRVIGQYRFTPDIQAYVSYAQGVNPGAFNAGFTSLTPAQQTFLQTTYGAGIQVKPEHLTNYEVGLKGRFWEGRAQLTLALYHADWTSQIISQNLVAPLPSGVGQTVIAAITNAGSTTLNGVEVEGAVVPVHGLSISFSGAIADSNVKQFACAACTTLTGLTSFSGKELPNYSKYSASVGAEYTHPLSDVLDGYGRVDFIYKSGLWDSVANIVKTDPQEIVNVRAGLKRGKYTLEAYVINLFQNTAPTSIENNIDILNFARHVANTGLQPPREAGVRFRYAF
jgi:iron complex outermembrane receptor protein